MQGEETYPLRFRHGITFAIGMRSGASHHRMASSVLAQIHGGSISDKSRVVAEPASEIIITSATRFQCLLRSLLD